MTRELEQNRRLAVVTGAGRGIGSAIADELASRGFGLIINSRNEQSLLKKKENLSKWDVPVYAEAGDVGDPRTADRIFEAVDRELKEGMELVIVNNAAISYIGLLQDMSDEAFEKLMRINVGGVYNICKRAVPRMLREKKGHIVNISSVWGEVGASMEVAYSASKGAVNAFTRALGKELAPSGIQVNGLSLGAIDTEMNSQLSASERKELEDEIPAGRFGTPLEAARFCAELCVSGAYLNGQIIRLDGAWI